MDKNISAEALNQIAKALGIARKAVGPVAPIAASFSILTDKEKGLRKRKRTQAKMARRRNRR